MWSRLKNAVLIALVALALMALAICVFWYDHRSKPSDTDPLDSQSQTTEDAGKPSSGDLTQTEVLPAPLLWRQVGASWRLRVKQYQAGSVAAVKFPKDWVFKPSVQAEFDVIVKVLPSRHQGDHTITRLCFTPDTGAPKHMADQRIVLEIDQSDGTYVDFKPRNLGMPIEIPFDGVDYLWDQLYGIPINWIVRNRDLITIPQAKSEHIIPLVEPTELVKMIEPVKIMTQSGSQCDAVRITLVERFTQDTFEHTVDKRSLYRTTQTWIPGERWWRSFQRIQSGTLDLEATLVEEK
jgi:hypothetical protein